MQPLFARAFPPAFPRLAAALALGAALASTSTAARAANIISFVAVGDGSVQADVPVGFDVFFNFGEATIGGGFNVLFPDAVFSFKSFVFSLSLGDDPDLRLMPPADATTGPFTVAFGNFAGLVGQKTIGTLTLLGKQNFALTSDPTGEQVLGGMDNGFPAGRHWEVRFSPSGNLTERCLPDVSAERPLLSPTRFDWAYPTWYNFTHCI